MVSDEALCRRVAKGDRDALETLIVRHYATIYRTLYFLSGRREIAEDLAQDCFVRVVEQLSAGKVPQHFKAWALRIATNLCRDRWRSSTYRREQTIAAETLSQLSEEGCERDEADRWTDHLTIEHALSQLPDDLLQVVVLHYYDDLSVAQVAEVLDLPPGTVKSKLHRAYQALAELLRPEQERQPPRQLYSAAPREQTALHTGQAREEQA